MNSDGQDNGRLANRLCAKTPARQVNDRRSGVTIELNLSRDIRRTTNDALPE